MELGIFEYSIAIAGGFVAGIMNTLAGYGSIITLTILMDVIGLPANIANGTNRVNVLANTTAAALGFYNNGKLDLKKGSSVLIIVCIGALLGIITAISVSNEQFRSVFKYLVIVLFFALIVNPKKWISESQINNEVPLWKQLLIYLPIGFYGGFIQMGMGVIFLMAGVLVSKYSIIKANALKSVIITVYTIMSLAIFQWKGMVDWKIGAIIAIGAALGGYLTAHYSTRLKNANLFAYRFMIVVVVVVILRTFGVF